MRRRQREDPHAPPPRLVRYDPADWPDAECPVCAFYDGLREWHEANPDAPLMVVEHLPDDTWECASKDL
jgi:hypothetical protein